MNLKVKVLKNRTRRWYDLKMRTHGSKISFKRVGDMITFKFLNLICKKYKKELQNGPEIWQEKKFNLRISKINES